MAKIYLISVGTIKEKYLTDAINEYKKRLGAYADIEEISIKEERIANEDNRAEIAAALTLEGEKIISKLPSDAYKIALCVEGLQMSSEELAAKIGEARDRSGKIALVIGSSHGLDESVKRACDLRLSVSKMTFPHQLMRVILLESLYRSYTIIHGKKYHK